MTADHDEPCPGSSSASIAEPEKLSPGSTIKNTIGRNEQKFCLRVDKFCDEPGACDPIDFYMLTRYPFHTSLLYSVETVFLPGPIRA